ncbi:MAG: response regulator, partial [Spirochaetota bacterium]
ILLVEDEYLPAIHLKTVLGRAGHEIIGPASTSTEALALARSSKPDIILMDIRLAGQDDGIETARLIGEFSGAKVIFMSGYQERELRDKAMLLGPLAFLVKPVLLKDIQAAISKFK